MKELHRRNTETVEQVIKEQNQKILDQQIRIDGLNNSMSILMERLNKIEQIILIQKIQSTGTGASVK